MKFEINDKEIYKHWSKERIQGYANEFNMSFLEALLYLWFFNNVSVSSDDQAKDLGREMYRKFARGTAKILELKEQQ